ncbi:Hypothetical protein (Fragment) [Durusdinium trenchii]|uniref:Uncharacterized protein n=1 Tax=Durusdinium trenchii TaxID=1381693 RepID=A0ABP0N5Q1_9DINO
MDCAAHARSLVGHSDLQNSLGVNCQVSLDELRRLNGIATGLMGVSNVVTRYSYAMQVTEEDYAHFREKGLESTCNFGFLIWDALPHYDFYVMQPSRESCPFGLSGGPLHRDKRRLAVVGGSAVSYVGGTTLIPAAIEQLWTSLGMAPVGQGLRAVTELYLKAVRSVLALEPYIPKVLPLRCAALRRVASACMLAAALLTFAAVSSFDLLNVMVASQDIAAARAASSGSSLAYLGFVSVGQVLQQLLLILFQVVIAASAQARYEAIGIFDPSCGYLVGSDDLDSESCPNWWHAPIDLIAIIVLMFGFVFCFVLILLLPFRRFIASPAARWVTASLFRHGLRRPLLWPAKLPEVDDEAADVGVADWSALHQFWGSDACGVLCGLGMGT